MPNNVIIGTTSLSDYDSQLTIAKKVYFELKTDLTIYGCYSLLQDVEAVWNIFSHDNLNKISSTATNQRISPEESKIFDEFKKATDKLSKDFNDWYKQELNQLTK